MLDITVIAFAHHKGGTGKTTSCLNVAGYLQKDGKRVLVVDCDPQANATSGLGVDPERVEQSMYDVFMSVFEGFPDVRITDIIVPTTSGIYLAPATLDLVGVEPYLYGIDDRAGILREVLTPVRDTYDFILIDTPPSMGQFVINGLVAADHTVVTLDAGTFALNGMEALSTIFNDIREMIGEDVNADFAILTRWGGPDDSGGGLALFLKRIFSPASFAEEEREKERLKTFESEVRKKFRQVFVVHYSPLIYEAQQKGLPISHYAPESKPGRDYRAVATALESLGNK
ncbi:ParA family protein [Methanoculleus receptaculi]|uniref:AAA family ATPase n=1 Tax=Methanoculleus receptaculi TaxID=394967 RepID=A0AAX4FTW0_9EURY|nr:AAA family ATPase [Methanoculleus receptaculi]WOX57235.1 AAA family ATPase [Methanoculleus receptaculi]